MVLRRRATGSVILLFTRFQGSQRPPLHLSHPCLPAGTHIPGVSIHSHPAPPVESRHRTRVALQSDVEVDCQATQIGGYFNGHRGRRIGRVHGWRTAVRHPICHGAFGGGDSKGEILHHRSTRATHAIRISTSAPQSVDECIHLARRPTQPDPQRYPAIPQA